ncbi:MAG: hypothetical protein ACTS2F_20720 [Thainema sp.]
MDISELKLTQADIEKLTDVDVGEIFVAGTVRPSVFQSPRRILSLCLSEILKIGVAFILCLGLSLIIVRNMDDVATRFLFLIAIALSVLIAMVWNVMIWLKGKRLQTLHRLLDEVDRHNDIIQALQIMDELNTVPTADLNLPNQDEVITALRATRESLACGLMTERILRKHQRFIQRRQELFINIETNLATLQSLSVNHQAAEYAQLLNEALEIGMTVHQEMKQRSQ